MGIEIVGLSDSVKQELLATIPARVGEPFTPELSSRVREAVRKVDEHLALGVMLTGAAEVRLLITVPGDRLATFAPQPAPRPFTPPAGAIRVEGNVTQAKLLTHITPAYPALAKAARVQGVVRFDAVIGKDGHVISIRLTSGRPLLAQAAMEAVRQWVYEPTLLNGNAVEVVTTVDVNFTLSQTVPE
ncbi:MAG: TonB family protein [Bryobacterales bacterium]|nr:TonB family protein [Bryobacterales bacterium]